MKKGEKKESPKIKELKHKARRKSIKEGMFAVGETSFGTSYIAPFAIALQASNSLISMFSAVSGLLGPLSQIFSSKLIEKYSRKKIILKSVLFESLVWLPIALIAILAMKNILTETLPLFLLILYALFIIIANISAPAWFSWMGDIVDDAYRGRWFSKRNLFTGLSSAVLALIASFILTYFENNNQKLIGFAILFTCAFLFKITSWHNFKKQYEPKIELKKNHDFSFMNFLSSAPKTNFGKFTIFRFFYAFACSISAPLLVVYLLKHLNLGYIAYIIIIYSGTLFSLFVIQLWGKLADTYGNYRVLVITSIITPLSPLLWILHPSPIYMIFVPSLIGGISWAGFNLCVGNFIYDNVSAQKRGKAVSYYNMLIGIGTFLGASVGAILIKTLPQFYFEPIILIFLIGTFVRMIVVFFGITKFKEIKTKKKFHGTKALKNIIFKEAGQTLNEEAHEIMSIKKYLVE